MHTYTLLLLEEFLMGAISVQRAVNSAVWISCGILIIGVRVVLFPNTSIIAYEILGVAMVIFGAARLLWAVARTKRSEPQ